MSSTTDQQRMRFPHRFPLGWRPIVGTAAFVLVALAIAAALVLAGKPLYQGVPGAAFNQKLGDLLLQLAVIVIAGALVKVLIDWGTAQSARYRQKSEDRLDFLRRTRAVHVEIENARTLMSAHRSAKTWAEQSRRLMALRPVVEDISADLEAAPRLFRNSKIITEALKGIVDYLYESEKEYESHHGHVDVGSKNGATLSQTIESYDMGWVDDFMVKGPHFRAGYARNLTASKGGMRLDVYGSWRKGTLRSILGLTYDKRSDTALYSESEEFAA